MATVRIQLRRGTSAEWTSADPVLAAGEMGLETDTGDFKFGDGSSAWSTLNYALGDSIDDYIPLSEKGVADGVATLDSNGYIPTSQLPDGAALDAEVAASISAHNDVTANVHGIADTSLLATQADVSASAASVTSALTSQINAAVAGISVKAAVRAVTDSNITLSGTQTVDDVALSVGDRVLVKSQTDATENGVYIVASGSWTRATDFDETSEVKEGNFVFAQEGTVNGSHGFVLISEGTAAGEAFNIGTDSLNFTKFTGSNLIFAGTGLIKSEGNTLSVDTTEIATVAHVGTSIDGLNATFDTKANLNGGATFTGTISLPSTTSIGDVSATEISYLDGLTESLSTSLTTIGSDIDSLETNFGTLSATVDTKAPLENAVLTGTVALPSTTSIGSVLDTEIAFLSGVTASIQSQIDTKSDSANPTFTGTVVLPSTTSIGDVSDTEISYLDGVTSSIQNQIDTKASNTDLSTHSSTTTGVHGITDTAALETQTGAQDKANAAQAAAEATAAADASTKADNAESAAITAAASAAAALYATIVDTAMTGTATAENLTLSGNLTVGGTTTTVSAQDLVVTDPLIYIGEGNTANAVDLGVVSSFDDGTYQHSGIVRDATDGIWKLFKGVTDEPTTTINFAQASYETLKLGGVEFSDGTQTKQGVPSQTTISEKTASYEFSSLDERDQMVEFNSSSAITVTVPLNSTVAYPIGTSIDLLRVGSGSVTVVGASGVTVNATPGNKLRAQWSSGTLFKRAENTWILVGDLSS